MDPHSLPRVARTGLVAVSVLTAAIVGIGCGSSSRSTPTETTAPAAPSTPTMALTGEAPVCQGSGPAVVLIVSPAIAADIRTGLTAFAQDLCRERYTVIERVRAYGSAPELRQHLAQLYTETSQRLQGAILVGDHPRAYQWVTAISSNPSFPSFSEEVISYQYYSDLDGAFEASAEYRSPGRHASSFDRHTGEVDWEIWVSVLPLYRDDTALTVDAVNRYFAKNHSYRTGQRALPRTFWQVSEHAQARTAAEHDNQMSLLRDGGYSWTPFSNAPGARLYFNSDTAGLSVDQGYADLSRGVADFSVANAHGFWGASGKLTTAWAESAAVRTVFFWSDGCAVGNLDQPRNFLTAILYSATSEVLVARGTTNDSGGMGNNRDGFYGHNIAKTMDAGGSLGQGLLAHVNVPLASPWSESREFHFATSVTLGDGTLTIRR